MNEELKKLLEELNRTWKEMTTELDSVKTAKDLSAEQKAKVEKMEEAIDKVEEQIQEIQVKLNRPAMVVELPEEEAKKSLKLRQQQKDVFFKLLSKGIASLTPEERKTMTLADEESLGALAPPEFVAEIIKDAVLLDPFRALCSQRTISGRSLQRPKRKTTLSASWIAETGLPTETTKTHTMFEIAVHKLGALAIISQDSRQDVALLEQDLRAEFSEQFNLSEGQAFLSGNGVGKPLGLLDTGSGVGGLTSGNANAVDVDDLIDIQTELKEPYWMNASWIFNRITLRMLRKLKDANGQYLWQPAIAAGAPSTILEKPYTLMPNMDNPTTGKKAIAYGDFRRAYMIVDRIDLAVQTLVEKYAPEIGFLGTKRVGGQVQLAEAVKILTVK